MRSTISAPAAAASTLMSLLQTAPTTCRACSCCRRGRGRIPGGRSSRWMQAQHTAWVRASQLSSLQCCSTGSWRQASTVQWEGKPSEHMPPSTTHIHSSQIHVPWLIFTTVGQDTLAAQNVHSSCSSSSRCPGSRMPAGQLTGAPAPTRNRQPHQQAAPTAADKAVLTSLQQQEQLLLLLGLTRCKSSCDRSKHGSQLVTSSSAAPDRNLRHGQATERSRRCCRRVSALQSVQTTLNVTSFSKSASRVRSTSGLQAHLLLLQRLLASHYSCCRVMTDTLQDSCTPHQASGRSGRSNATHSHSRP
jgi:hypothetical protein